MPDKIVVLDGYTMNPGDLDWSPLKALGEVAIHERTPPDATVDRAAGAALVLTNKVVLGRAEIEALPELRYIGVLATGYNVIDCDAARARDIVVTNVPAYSTESVAQMVFAHILHHLSAVAAHSASVQAGDWAASPDFSYQVAPLRELAGKSLGIVGFGAIGQAVARLAMAFGMRVLVHTRTPKDVAGVDYMSLENLLRHADIVTLHCPLTPQTEGLINDRALAMLQPHALLVNTGRGPLLDEQAVADALNEGRLAGLGLDVLSTEPPAADNPLLTARNCSITPHIAWATREARQRLLDTAVANLRAFQAGEPVNIVNA